MLFLAMFITLVLIIATFGLLIHRLINFSKDDSTIPIEPEPLFSTTSVLCDLPKTSIKNSHWFTHTFMRPRRKG